MRRSCSPLKCVFRLWVGVISLASVGWVSAHGPGHHGRSESARPAAAAEQKPWGVAGAASSVRRTIEISMGDDMRFQPSHFDARLGETVRLVIRNRGALMHELVIGTRDELDSHAALMLKHPNMEHDEPWMAHVEPGRSGDLIWTFNRAGEFEFACLLPGHFQAGMRGTIRVR
ncbi:MAG: cupredoxin family protein [Betaproteobacteria bacterium]|nr:cupredoxin family protein [Betaproteobacteria bacterium]